jgi:sRNA-binding protein
MAHPAKMESVRDAYLAAVDECRVWEAQVRQHLAVVDAFKSRYDHNAFSRFDIEGASCGFLKNGQVVSVPPRSTRLASLG